MTTLIFPAGMPGSIAFLHECIAQNRCVIGASSLKNDPSRELYPLWEFLPYITDASFLTALQSVFLRHGITAVYTPNPTVWEVLNTALPTLSYGVKLLGESPVERVLAPYRSSRMVARGLWEYRDFLGNSKEEIKPRIGESSFVALVHHANGIAGMCDHQKLLALAEISRNAPPGDVVEIGSWWGKSAFILSFLAKQYRIGNVLCVDPWSSEHALQDVKILDDMSDQMHIDESHLVFQINLLPYSNGTVNFLRLPAVEAAQVYSTSRSVYSESFGQTQYFGKISILHIDGNHKRESVQADIDAWKEFMLDDGWIIFDDYRWPFGDGPKVVADDFILTNQSNVSTAFYMGGAMFVKLGKSQH